MKVESFFEDGFSWSKIAEEPKCGMDELVEKLADEEAAYWEMKAEVHFGL
tara:strand:+ start:373 stop:522 length:150 start_codon:yes stop_codon:yes gene_type:complete